MAVVPYVNLPLYLCAPLSDFAQTYRFCRGLWFLGLSYLIFSALWLLSCAISYLPLTKDLADQAALNFRYSLFWLDETFAMFYYVGALWTPLYLLDPLANLIRWQQYLSAAVIRLFWSFGLYYYYFVGVTLAYIFQIVSTVLYCLFSILFYICVAWIKCIGWVLLSTVRYFFVQSAEPLVSYL
jgi:hypothetical protein